MCQLNVHVRRYAPECVYYNKFTSKVGVSIKLFNSFECND